MTEGKKEVGSSLDLHVRFNKAVEEIEEAFKTVQMTHLEGASGYQEIANMGMAAIPLMAERMREIVDIEDDELKNRGYHDPNRAFYWFRVLEKIITPYVRSDDATLFNIYEKFDDMKESSVGGATSFRERCRDYAEWCENNSQLFQ